MPTSVDEQIALSSKGSAVRELLPECPRQTFVMVVEDETCYQWLMFKINYYMSAAYSGTYRLTHVLWGMM